MDQRLSVVTLGVSDLARARKFYEALGWSAAENPGEDVVFFQAGGMVVSLWDRTRLAEELHRRGRAGLGRHHARSQRPLPEEADAVLADAEAAGATIGRPGAETFWGGYSGVFIDPDGHPWEVAHNPFWTIADDGSTKL